MATDVEESDTDDHERPAPPKRQCTRICSAEDNIRENKQEEEQGTKQDTNTDAEHEELVKHDREKLKRWQACQVAKGFVDNTINKVLENYIMTPASHPLADYRLCLLRRNEMEDTAVSMAIRNHGLVQSADLVPRSDHFCGSKAPEYWTNGEQLDVQCSCPSNRLQEDGGISSFAATTSSDSFRYGNLDELGRYSGVNSNTNRTDDSDRQEDFLERAVAEAIKKKGLSALSVDYG